jgi:hypothetical protein
VRFQPARREDRSLVSGRKIGFNFHSFFISDEEILRFQGTKPPIVSEVTADPIDSGRQEEKNGEAG